MTPTPWTPENTPKRLEVILTDFKSDRALARKLGIHYVTLSRWRNGHRAPQKLLWPVLDQLEADAVKNYHLKRRGDENS